MQPVDSFVKEAAEKVAFNCAPDCQQDVYLCVDTLAAAFYDEYKLVELGQCYNCRQKIEGRGNHGGLKPMPDNIPRVLLTQELLKALWKAAENKETKLLLLRNICANSTFKPLYLILKP